MSRNTSISIGIVALLSVSLFLFSCSTTGSRNYNEVIENYKSFDDLADRLHFDSDTTYVLNFWATTCPPCLREMPHFEALSKNDAPKPMKVLLISLDRPQDYDRIKPFVLKHQIHNEVVHLQDENYSAWLDYIDSSWFGALPATLIRHKNKRQFKFGAYEALSTLENDLLKVY